MDAFSKLVARGVLQKKLRIDICQIGCCCKIHEVEGLRTIKYYQDGTAVYFSFPSKLSAHGHYLATYYLHASCEFSVNGAKFTPDRYKDFLDLFDQLSLINVNNKRVCAAEDTLAYIQNSRAYIIDDKHHDFYYADKAIDRCIGCHAKIKGCEHTISVRVEK